MVTATGKMGKREVANRVVKSFDPFPDVSKLTLNIYQHRFSGGPEGRAVLRFHCLSSVN
jgi:hypothetical protein